MLMKWWKFLVLVALCGVAAQAAALSGKEIDGVVLDKVTGKPVAGAVVLATWNGRRSDLAHGASVCYHVETARTDAAGKYRIAAWSEPFAWRRAIISDRTVWVQAFKAGYVRPTKGVSTGGKVFVIPKEQSTYFASLDGFFISSICPEAGESGKNLYPFLDAIVAEAKLVAQTPEQHATVKGMAYVRDRSPGAPVKR